MALLKEDGDFKVAVRLHISYASMKCKKIYTRIKIRIWKVKNLQILI